MTKLLLHLCQTFPHNMCLCRCLRLGTGGHLGGKGAPRVLLRKAKLLLHLREKVEPLPGLCRCCCCCRLVGHRHHRLSGSVLCLPRRRCHRLCCGYRRRRFRGHVLDLAVRLGMCCRHCRLRCRCHAPNLAVSLDKCLLQVAAPCVGGGGVGGTRGALCDELCDIICHVQVGAAGLTGGRRRRKMMVVIVIVMLFVVLVVVIVVAMATMSPVARRAITATPPLVLSPPQFILRFVASFQSLLSDGRERPGLLPRPLRVGLDLESFRLELAHRRVLGVQLGAKFLDVPFRHGVGTRLTPDRR